MEFKRAVRKQAKLRLGLTGPSGSGKTYSALLIAAGIGGRVAVIDTEKGSASLYSHLLAFDTLDLSPPYSPERFIAAIHAAESAGYDTLVIDSITHEWSGSGGCLEINETIAKARYTGNTWSAWNETTPRHRAFIDAILHSPIHIIACMRSKTETVQQDKGNGKKAIVKLGMKAEQRDGTDYELTTVLDITHEDHLATASKDRTGLFTGDPQRITEDTGRRLLEWLNSGAEVTETPSDLPKIDADGIVLPADELWSPEVFKAGQEAAKRGMTAYQEFWQGCDADWRRKAAKSANHEEFKRIAGDVK